MYDVIIIGGGPAGLTAAIYLARKQMKIILVSQGIGGQIMDAPTIENYPGFDKISGPDLVEKLQKHAESSGAEINAGFEVKKILKNTDSFEIESVGGEKISAKSVIICSGKRPRKLGVAGEDKFIGKGVSVCVTCDGPLFANKDVAVIGGGNSAIAAALELEKYANKIYILNIGAQLFGEEIRIKKIQDSKKIEVISQAKTTEITGENLVSGIKYQDMTSKTEKELKVQGIFVEIGWEPSTGYLEGFIDMTDKKEIKIDKDNKTNIPGVFAAGDVTEISKKQMIIAAGEGAKASLNAWDYLQNN